MNNKGFAITGILYGLMLIFILVLTSFLSILVGKNRRIDELEKSVYESVKLSHITIELTDEVDKYQYTTLSNAIYTIKYSGRECNAILPINTVLISGNVKSNGVNDDKVYYKVGGSSNLDDFEELGCIN